MKFYLFLFCLSINLAFAQQSTVRNQLMVGARPYGMGEAFTAVANDANALGWNPAGLPDVNRFELSGMHTNLYQTGLTHGNIGLVIPYSERLGLGLNWSSLQFGDDELNYQHHIMQMSGGFHLFKGLALGFTGKYLNTSARLDDYQVMQGSGWSSDMGVLVSPGSWLPALSFLKFGMMMQDVFDGRLTDKQGNSQTIYPKNLRLGLCCSATKWGFIEYPLIAVDWDDRFHAGVEGWLALHPQFELALRGGLQRDVYEGGQSQWMMAFGSSIKSKISDHTAVQFDFAFNDQAALMPTHRYALHLSFALPQSPVKFREVHIENMYASLYPWHIKQGVGEMVCEYSEEERVVFDAQLETQHPEITFEKRITLDPQINPEDSLIHIQIMPVFNQTIAALRGVQTLQAQLTLQPQSLIRSQKDRQLSNPFQIYGLGKINWSLGESQIAAFVTPQDPVVRQFAAQTIDDFDYKISKPLTPAILQAAKLYQRLAGNLHYIGDENSVYGEDVVDTILYSRELLSQTRGDCDDLTVLFASLLESIGIETLILCTDDHVFLAFDSGLHPNQRGRLCLPDSHYILYQQRVWIPIEMTLIGDSTVDFWQAWELGKINMQQKTVRKMETHTAWQQYIPLPVQILSQFNAPDLNLFPVRTHPVSLSGLQSTQKHYFNVVKQQAQDAKNIQAQLKLANLYALFDSTALAALQLKQVEPMHPFASAVNMGNVMVQTRQYESALDYFKKAFQYARSDADSILVLHNLHCVYQHLENTENAREIAAQLQALGGQTGGSLKGKQNQPALPEILYWIDTGES